MRLPPSWCARSNPSAGANVQRLLDRWRTQGWPVWHIRHDSTDPKSHQRPGQQGNDFKPAVTPLAGEPIIPKRTNNALIRTDLEARLRAGGHRAWLRQASSGTTRWKQRCAWPAILNLLPTLFPLLRPHGLEWHPAKRGRRPCRYTFFWFPHDQTDALTSSINIEEGIFNLSLGACEYAKAPSPWRVFPPRADPWRSRPRLDECGPDPIPHRLSPD